jgi:hypothetical protein
MKHRDAEIARLTLLRTLLACQAAFAANGIPPAVGKTSPEMSSARNLGIGSAESFRCRVRLR